MTGWWSWVVVVWLWLLSCAAPASAQLPLSTFAGRQIGDGRAATAASLARPSGVAFAPDGALLIGDRDHDRLRRVDSATGVITTLAGSVAGTSGNGMVADQAELKDPLRVTVEAPTGDLLIAEFGGHVVARLVAATGVLVVIAGTPDTPGVTGDGALATAALLNGPTEAVRDGSGGILIADRSNHKIRRVDALNNINTVAGIGTPGYTGDTIPGGATLAALNLPACVLPITGGGFFLCDEGNHVIRHVSALGTITTVAGNGMAGSADGPATAGAQLNEPVGLAFADATGTVLLIAESGGNRIRRLDLTAATVTTIAGTGTAQFSPDGSAAATSPVSAPVSVTVAPDGRIVFAESLSHRVRAIDAAGNLVTLAGDGVAFFTGDGGPAAEAQFGQVKSVARASNGDVLISDSGNNRVRRVRALTGVVETIAGSGDAAFSGEGGPAVDAGLTVSDAIDDAAGNVVFSDTDNHRIRRIDANGNITTIVGTGVPGFAGDGGPASAAQINHPTGLELDAAGNLYIAEFGNHAIRKVDPSGNITTVAGTGLPGFNGDNIAATSATLNGPTDLDVDGAGNLYIADFDNHRIRFVEAATGAITTIAGTGVRGNTGDGGLATTARLDNPSCVKLDETGAVWVTDFGNHRVRRFTVGGDIAAAVGSGLRGYAGDGGDPLQARLLFPIRLDVIASDRVLIADRDNFVIRLLGDLPLDCTGGASATCVPGGGKASADCFMEFKIAAALPGGVPPPRISCVDGDPSCDTDSVNGQCTLRIAGCLNNEDPRVVCTPGAITTIKLAGNQASGAGGQALAAGLGALAPSTPLTRGRGVAFTTPFGERNGCTELESFVVARPRRKGKGKLNAVTSTVSSGRDKDKLKLFCLAP